MNRFELLFLCWSSWCIAGKDIFVNAPSDTKEQKLKWQIHSYFCCEIQRFYLIMQEMNTLEKSEKERYLKHLGMLINQLKFEQKALEEIVAEIKSCSDGRTYIQTVQDMRGELNRMYDLFLSCLNPPPVPLLPPPSEYANEDEDGDVYFDFYNETDDDDYM